MKRYYITIAFILVFSFAGLNCDAEPEFKVMLKNIDAMVTFDQSDFSAECKILQTKPGEGSTTMSAALFRRDKSQTYLIIILEPKTDRGKGYLKIDQGLWLYDPKARKFEFTSSKERFQNSNARNSDFTQSNFADDYEVTASNRETLGKFDCWVLDLKAASMEVTFPICKIWISDDNLVRKTQDYSLAGQILRTTVMPSYQKVGERYIPNLILIIDALRGKTIGGKFENETTEITITKPSLEKLPDALFTKAYLEKMAR